MQVLVRKKKTIWTYLEVLVRHAPWTATRYQFLLFILSLIRLPLLSISPRAQVVAVMVLHLRGSGLLHMELLVGLGAVVRRVGRWRGRAVGIRHVALVLLTVLTISVASRLLACSFLTGSPLQLIKQMATTEYAYLVRL